MTIGIIYIATGPYIEFLTEFYELAEKNFISEAAKQYFVFTDREHPYLSKPNVVVIPQHQEYWPYVALHKFHYILEAQHLYENIDFLFLTNANLKFITTISAEEILPTESENYLVATEGPWPYKPTRKYYHLDDGYFDEDRDIEAYVPKSKRKIYLGAGLVGGRKKEFLEMSYTIRNMIEKDLSKNKIPIWHDQSYLNKYFIVDKNLQIKILNPGFLYPEDFDIPFRKRILIVSKRKRSNYLMSYYRKYHWLKNEDRDKSNFYKLKKYIIYKIIKFLEKL